MSKVSTSISIDQETIDIINQIREKRDIKPSFSEMVEHLVKTNTTYMEHEMSRKSFKRPDKKKH